MLLFVGVTGFEPATTRPPDAYSNRAELHPVRFCSAKVLLFFQPATKLEEIFQNIFIFISFRAKTRVKVPPFALVASLAASFRPTIWLYRHRNIRDAAAPWLHLSAAKHPYNQ